MASDSMSVFDYQNDDDIKRWIFRRVKRLPKEKRSAYIIEVYDELYAASSFIRAEIYATIKDVFSKYVGIK